MNTLFEKMFFPSTFRTILLLLFFYFLFCISNTNSYAATPLKTSQVITKNGYTVNIAFSKFDQKKHKLDWCEKGYLCNIDGAHFIGTDGSMPVASIHNIYLNLNGKAINLSSKNMYIGSWKYAELNAINITVRKLSKHLFKVRGVFSDGAGAFYAEWNVLGGTSMRTVLSDSESLIDFHAFYFKNKSSSKL